MGDIGPDGGQPPTFDVVLRGYDRAQVKAVVAEIMDGGVPADFRGFDVALRGYERRQVDELARRVLATIGGDPSAGPPVTREQIRKGGPFGVTLRGYERAQVDAWLSDHVDRLPE